jgi:hypothetical protein
MAASNLGTLLLRRGETRRAYDALQRAADLGYAPGATHLGLDLLRRDRLPSAAASSSSVSGAMFALNMQDTFESTAIPLYARMFIRLKFGGLAGLGAGLIDYTQTRSGGAC